MSLSDLWGSALCSKALGSLLPSLNYIVEKRQKSGDTSIGIPLGEYSLSCPPKQGAKHGSRSVDMRGLVQGHSPHVHRQGSVRSASPALRSVSSQRQSRPLLINSVLSFVKAYRLKGDIESL